MSLRKARNNFNGSWLSVPSRNGSANSTQRNSSISAFVSIRRYEEKADLLGVREYLRVVDGRLVMVVIG